MMRERGGMQVCLTEVLKQSLTSPGAYSNPARSGELSQPCPLMSIDLEEMGKLLEIYNLTTLNAEES